MQLKDILLWIHSGCGLCPLWFARMSTLFSLNAFSSLIKKFTKWVSEFECEFVNVRVWMSVCKCQCVQLQWEEFEGNSGNSIALLTALRPIKRRSQRKSFFIFLSFFSLHLPFCPRRIYQAGFCLLWLNPDGCRFCRCRVPFYDGITGARFELSNWIFVWLLVMTMWF